MTKKILIASGGTGGHVFPAEQLADSLLQKNAFVVFAGYKLISHPLFSREKYSFKEIKSAPINKKRMHVFAFRIIVGFFQARRFLKKKKFDVVVGFGSYHTFPVLLAAKSLSIPIVLFEANVTLGKVNQFFSGYSEHIAVQFPQVINYENTSLVKSFPWKIKTSKRELHLKVDKTTFLIFGGSTGAVFINRFFLKNASILKEIIGDFQVIHLIGKNMSEKEVNKKYTELGITSYVKSFEEDMDLIYKSSNFVICRAGAASIAELIHYEKPALLVPYPFAYDHQDKNADFFVDIVGGGIKREEKNLTRTFFLKDIQNLMDGRKEHQKQIQIYKQQMGKRKDLASLVLDVSSNRE